MAAPDKYVVRLTPEERVYLESIATKGVVAAAKIIHSRILLKTDADGPAWSDAEIAKALDITPLCQDRCRV